MPDDVHSRRSIGLDLGEVMAALFRAASGAASWDDALRPITVALEAHHCSIWLRSNGDLRPVAFIADTIPAEITDEYRRHWGALDPLAPLCAARPRGSVFTSDEVLPFEQLARSAYYNDWMGRHGMRRFIGAACPLPCDDSFVAIAFQRPLGSAPFEARDRELMAIVVPQLAAATEVWTKIRGVEERARDLAAMLDAADAGMAILDANGRVSLHNRQLGVTLGRRDGLDLDCERRLRAALIDDLQLALAIARQRACVVEIPRPSGARAYRIVATPFVEDGSSGARRAVIVRVHDPDVQDHELERRLCERFDLTPAEAEVAVQLARGRAVEEIATITRRSIGTARNLIKRAFAKTATHRQAALVALVCAIERDGI